MRNYFLLLALGAAISLQAQINTTFPARQKFIHYAEPNGFVMIEAIEPGMTLYSLSRKYNIGIDSILAVNPDLDPQAIPLGYPVNIPLCSKAITFHEPSEPDAEIPLYYRVQPKETMYRISKVYLNASPEIILGLNPLASINLSIGQVLLLGWYSPGRNTHNPATSINSSPIDSTSFHVKNYEEDYKTQGKIIVEQKGLAVWKPGNDKTHYFVLHPTALVGSIMEVTNPMLHRTLTAKVAGHIPPGLYPTNVGLVVSPSVARALGVLDQQFFAKWRFVE